jgi:glycosyltransferase involved in cell wall biosynthesis
MYQPSTKRPVITVGMPVYNGEVFLLAALHSILTQTWPDFELLICDNASTDRTAEICLDLSASDRRIRYHRNERNLGAAANYNLCFRMSQSRYFKWAAHDDLLAPDYLRRCIRALEEHPSSVLCHSRTDIIDEKGEFLETYGVRLRVNSHDPTVRFRDLIWVRHWCMHVFGLIRRDALERTRLHGAYASSDRVLMLELALQGPFVEVPETLFFSRKHGGQASRMVHDLHAYGQWFGAGSGQPARFPASTLVLEHARAVALSPLSNRERLKCYLMGLARLIKFAPILSRDATGLTGGLLRRTGA